MRSIVVAFLVLLLSTSALAAETQDVQTISQLESFLLSINPIILIISGAFLLVASSLARFIGIAMILIGVATFVLSLF